MDEGYSYESHLRYIAFYITMVIIIILFMSLLAFINYEIGGSANLSLFSMYLCSSFISHRKIYKRLKIINCRGSFDFTIPVPLNPLMVSIFIKEDINKLNSVLESQIILHISLVIYFLLYYGFKLFVGEKYATLIILSICMLLVSVCYIFVPLLCYVGTVCEDVYNEFSTRFFRH